MHNCHLEITIIVYSVFINIILIIHNLKNLTIFIDYEIIIIMILYEIK